MESKIYRKSFKRAYKEFDFKILMAERDDDGFSVSPPKYTGYMTWKEQLPPDLKSKYIFNLGGMLINTQDNSKAYYILYRKKSTIKQLAERNKAIIGLIIAVIGVLISIFK